MIGGLYTICALIGGLRYDVKQVDQSQTLIESNEHVFLGMLQDVADQEMLNFKLIGLTSVIG